MDWLNDPKNKNKVAGGLAGVIVLMIVVIYFVYLRPAPAPLPSDSGTEQAATDPSMQPPAQPQPGMPGPDAGMPPGGAPGQPGMPPTQAMNPNDPNQMQGQQPQQAQVQIKGQDSPLEAFRSDPFAPLGYKAPKGPKVKTTPPIPDLPFALVPNRWQPKPPEDLVRRDLAQPPRRMAGLLINNRVYAIIDTNGISEIVQPGDTLQDRLASVERIESDKVVLKTKDVPAKYIVVRMASAPRTDTSNTGPSSSSSSRPMPPGGRYPGGGVGPEGDINPGGGRGVDYD